MEGSPSCQSQLEVAWSTDALPQNAYTSYGQVVPTWKGLVDVTSFIPTNLSGCRIVLGMRTMKCIFGIIDASRKSSLNMSWCCWMRICRYGTSSRDIIGDRTILMICNKTQRSFQCSSSSGTKSPTKRVRCRPRHHIWFAERIIVK